MELNIIFKRGASFDVQEAFDYYDKLNSDLSASFVHQIEVVLDKIQLNPPAFQKKYGKVRIVFTQRFPCGIHYVIDDKTVIIHAVFHTSQKPKK